MRCAFCLTSRGLIKMPRLPVATNASAIEMAEEIFGDGVIVDGATYTGDNRSSGIYQDGATVSPGVTPSDTGVILSTGRARDFTNRNGEFNQSTGRSTNTNGEDNNAELNALAGTSTFDASYLTVDFIPSSEIMTMQFVFASDEFPEYTDSIYQDFVAITINGETVPMDIGNGAVDPGNINGSENQNLFIDNTADDYNTEMDGFTLTLTMTIPVNSGEMNTIRIAIADVSDSSYDSALLIAGNSVQTVLIANTDEVNIGLNSTKTVDILDNDIGNGTLTITHINGVSATVDTPIPLTNGQFITLNDDGTVTIDSDGDEEVVNLTYTVADDSGNLDIGYVTINQAPCFVLGTLIRTPSGDVPVEDLAPGDLVETLDIGAQPVRWIGRRKVKAQGKLAPIRISKDTFGEHGELLLSPLHRVLITDVWAQLLFGEAEVLIPARDLVNDCSVVSQPGGWVEYFHILFDHHQIIFSANLATEIYLPGPQTAESFEPGIAEEIYSLFPESNPETGMGYGPMVRCKLKHFEAATLSALAVAA